MSSHYPYAIDDTDTIETHIVFNSRKKKGFQFENLNGNITTTKMDFGEADCANQIIFRQGQIGAEKTWRQWLGIYNHLINFLFLFRY
mgnify:CR=1 FL=1